MRNTEQPAPVHGDPTRRLFALAVLGSLGWGALHSPLAPLLESASSTTLAVASSFSATVLDDTVPPEWVAMSRRLVELPAVVVLTMVVPSLMATALLRHTRRLRVAALRVSAGATGCILISGGIIVGMLALRAHVTDTADLVTASVPQGAGGALVVALLWVIGFTFVVGAVAAPFLAAGDGVKTRQGHA